MGISAYALAKRIRVAPPRINDIVLERRGITADTAVRLAKSLGTTPEFWTNAQAFYEIREAQQRLARDLARIEPRQVA